ncbi:MAG: CpaF family protein [Lachnospira sp.]
MDETLFAQIKAMVYEELDVSCEVDDDSVSAIIERCIYLKSRERMIPLSVRENIQKRLFDAIRRYDILQELLEDDSVTEIMVNGYKDIYIEREGVVTKWGKAFEDESKLCDIAQRIAALSNRIVNESSPIVDTRLNDGSRVNIVLPPIALNGPTVTIRKFYDTPLSMERMIELGSISLEAAEFLKKAVIARYNIFISGGTGSGKTTFLNALSSYIPSDERVITIEDSAELKLNNISNLVRLEARNANIEGKMQISIRDLIRSSLRMRPDRIIVGEVRGEEAIDMLQAMNTGHDGSLSTGHSNSSRDMLSRLETMVLMGMDIPITAVRQQIASSIDIIVHLKRMRDKTRKVVEISEVGAYENERIQIYPLYRYVEEPLNGEHTKCISKDSLSQKRGMVYGALKKQDRELDNTSKMFSAGIYSW